MRDFFDQQEAARRLSGRLAAILAVAVLGTVVTTAVAIAGLATILALLQFVATTDFAVEPAYWLGAFVSRFFLATVVAGAMVFGVAVQRTLRALESGGMELARQMGGTRLLNIGPDPQYQQLINVVEELSIAAGVKTPKIYVLEDENGINAFATGIEPADTVVGVTRGALEYLDRSQLQGVLAHEFSHIVNRDVRINVQTFGVLQGIEAIASAARFLFRAGNSFGIHGCIIATAFGCVMWPVGQIGVLFGSFARMALNRQREYLADAAAVQFTRYPEGLSSALKLIAAHARHGQMKSGTAQAASHLFFAEGAPVSGCLFRSHPPIEMRIRRLDPEWDGVLPIVLPALAVAVIDRRDDNQLDDEVEVAPPQTHKPTAVVSELKPIAPSPPVPAPIPSSVSTADAGSFAVQGRISEADKQALLEAVARARADSTRQDYKPHVTHWPTLAATAAAVLGALILFSWLTLK